MVKKLLGKFRLCYLPGAFLLSLSVIPIWTWKVANKQLTYIPFKILAFIHCLSLLILIVALSIVFITSFCEK